MENKEGIQISTNIFYLTRIFIGSFVVLSLCLVYWQVWVAPQVTANIHNVRHCLADSAPRRGRIFDRNGVLLADSQPIDPKNPNAPNLCAFQRHYYLQKYPSLAALIGYYISPLDGITGIEQAYNTYLDGQVGLTQLNNTLNGLFHRAPVGDDIYLTIDTRIQAQVEYAFDHDSPPPDGHNIFASNRGSVIVSDPRTGQILALLSRPTFDSNRVASGDLNYFSQLQADHSNNPLLDRPLEGRYVPGSIYKTVTLLAALDSGHARLDDLFYDDHLSNHPQAIGPVVLGSGEHVETFGPAGNNICCYTHKFPVTLDYGYTHSDNIIFAQVGVKTGLATWLNYNQRLGVGKPIAVDNLKSVASSVTPSNGAPLTVPGLGEDSFGQGVDFITPLQMSQIDNTIANNGVLMRPAIIEKIVDPNGSVIQSASPQALGTPISAQTAAEVRDAMFGVVQCGSGRFANPNPLLWQSPWAIIGKTGTGEVLHNTAQAWLITQAPYQDGTHRLTIVAMKENAGEGGSVNGPMEMDLYNKIFSSIIKIPLPPAADPNYCFSTGLLQ